MIGTLNYQQSRCLMLVYNTPAITTEKVLTLTQRFSRRPLLQLEQANLIMPHAGGWVCRQAGLKLVNDHLRANQYTWREERGTQIAHAYVNGSSVSFCGHTLSKGTIETAANTHRCRRCLRARELNCLP